MNLSPFGCIVPGCLPNTGFVQQDDPNKWMLDMGYASESVVIFLTGVAPIPAGQAVGIYMATQAELSWNFVGYLTNQMPSSIVQVPFPLLNVSCPSPLVVGLQVDTESNVLNLGITSHQPMEQRRAASIEDIARRVAGDLYTFLISYAKILSSDPADPQSVETVYLPANYVDKWRERLLTKITKDASFWK